ncbi:glycosyltransferase [Niallia circulans]|jgi:glycosyltransferase involved in cell wall biosynthesis|nr:glycosyltransferase [Niallia circulans]
MQPIVSVIMPVHNNREFIEESVKSILNQTLTSFELLIIDDGSTDGTGEYILSLEDSRISYHYLNKNRGIVFALNKGLSLAKGNYIARMDGDDFAYSRRLEKQVEFLENNSEYVLVATEVKTFSHEKDIKKSHLEELQNWYNYAHSAKEISERLWIGNCLNHPSVMFRRSILKVLDSAYNFEYQYAEDYEFFFRMSHKGKMFKLTEKLLKYRVHSKQLSTTFSQKQREIDAKIKVSQIKRLLDQKTSINKVFIWGSGGGGKLIHKELEKNNMRIFGFIDINSLIWGEKSNGVTIYSPLGALNEKFDLIIIATSTGRDYAVEFLKQKGFMYLQHYIPVW